MVEQNLKLNDEYVDYKFVYSSKHNFFKFVTKEKDPKNYFLKKVIPLKKKISVPSNIKDNNLNENSFIERVLDHCTYASMKNIKDQEYEKKLKFKKFGECKLKYINDKNLNNLTLKKFTEDTNKIAKKNTDENSESSLKTIEKEDQVSENDKVKKKMDNKIIAKYKIVNLSLFWENLNYPVITSLQMNDKSSGIIKLTLNRTNEKCIGTVAINKNKRGSWSFICPDSKKRKKELRKNLNASGTLKINSKNFIEGIGYDTNKNKIEFVAKKNIYE